MEKEIIEENVDNIKLQFQDIKKSFEMLRKEKNKYE
jgi:hypothetical protein